MSTISDEEQRRRDAVVDEVIRSRGHLFVHGFPNIADAATNLLRYQEDSAAKASAPVAPRCEPPEEFRHLRWHWLESITGQIAPWEWANDMRSWQQHGTSERYASDEVSSLKYHSPATPNIREKPTDEAISAFIRQWPAMTLNGLVSKALTHFNAPAIPAWAILAGTAAAAADDYVTAWRANPVHRKSPKLDALWRKMVAACCDWYNHREVAAIPLQEVSEISDGEIAKLYGHICGSEESRETVIAFARALLAGKKGT